MKLKILCFFLICLLHSNLSANIKKNAVDIFNDAQKTNDLMQSERLLNSIITEYPTSIYAPRALAKLAEINFLKNNYKAAAENYEKIIQLYSNSDIYQESLFNYALTIYMLGQYQEAEKSLKLYLSKFPADDEKKYDIHIKLGDIYYNRGEIAEALSQYQNSLLFFKNNNYKSWVYFQIGNCYNYAKQFTEAFIAYMTVVKFFPNSLEYYQALEMINKLKENNNVVEYKIWQDNNPAYRFYIQLGAFKNKEGAEKTLNEYANNSEYSKRIIKIVQDNGLFKVRLGNFFSFEEANKFKKEKKLKGFVLTE